MVPSSESSTAQSSAKKLLLSSLKSGLVSWVEHQRWGFEESRLKSLQLNWQVVWMPLHDAACQRVRRGVALTYEAYATLL